MNNKPKSFFDGYDSKVSSEKELSTLLNTGEVKKGRVL